VTPAHLKLVVSPRLRHIGMWLPVCDKAILCLPLLCDRVISERVGMEQETRIVSPTEYQRAFRQP
jgi:hypothetical protein